MFLEQVISQLLNITVWDILKVAILILLGMYLVFAAVIIRQVGLMTKAVQIELGGLIKFIAWTHLLLAILVFFVTFATL